MSVKLNLSFNVNGKKHGSTKEMPESFEEAYEKALAAPPSAGAGGITISQSTQIVVNGQTYESVDAMPPEARKFYQMALGAVADNLARADAGGAAKGAEPQTARADGGDEAELPAALPEPEPDATERLFSVQALIIAALLSGVILAVCYLIRWVGW